MSAAIRAVSTLPSSTTRTYLGRKGTVIIIVAPLARRPFARSRVTSPPRTSTNPAMPTIRRPRLCLRSWPVTPRRSERATSPNGWWLLEAASRGFRAQSTSPTRVTFLSCSSAGTCSAARYRLGRTRTGTGSRLIAHLLRRLPQHDEPVHGARHRRSAAVEGARHDARDAGLPGRVHQVLPPNLPAPFNMAYAILTNDKMLTWTEKRHGDSVPMLREARSTSTRRTSSRCSSG